MKEPRFFCEHCGAEVRRDARICPRCGHFFSSVKCPKCGFSGKPDDFLAGCPSCGYSLPPNPAPEPFKAAPPPKVPASPLSAWAYAAAAVVLVALVIALVDSLR